MIKPQTIQAIVDACQIEDVVGDFVPLKRRGTNMQGICPFHDERTPSFSVSPTKGIYKCFGCGAGGNSINFVMEHEKMSYPEALRYLAQKYNIAIEESLPENKAADDAAKTEREALFIVNEFAQKYFAETLLNQEEGKRIGLSYFKERGVSDQMISLFGLGYAVDAWDDFYKTALKNGYKEQYLETAGLVVKSEKGKVFDRFHGRILFPIQNISGKIAGFGARTLGSDAKTAKYLNSPQSEIYDKSKTLYGIFQAKKSILAQDQTYLVEGYLDVISLHQIGIGNTVASSGTSLTGEQAKLLRRFSPHVCILYDGDAAGIKASLRSIDILLENDLNVQVCLLPNGSDPDSHSRKLGAAAFKDFLTENRQDFISFKANLLLQDAGNDPVKQAAVIKDMVESVSKINDAIKRALFATQISRQLNISEQLIIQEINRLKLGKNKQEYTQNTQKSPQNEPAAAQAITEASKDIVQEIDVIYLLMRHAYKPLPEFGDILVVELFANELEGVGWQTEELLSIFELYKTAHGIGAEIDTKRDLIYNQNVSIAKIAAELSQEPETLSKNWAKRHDILVKNADDNYQNEVIYALLHLLQTKLAAKIIANRAKLKYSTDDKEIDGILETQKDLDAQKLEIAMRLGSVIVK